MSVSIKNCKVLTTKSQEKKGTGNNSPNSPEKIKKVISREELKNEKTLPQYNKIDIKNPHSMELT